MWWPGHELVSVSPPSFMSNIKTSIRSKNTLTNKGRQRHLDKKKKKTANPLSQQVPSNECGYCKKRNCWHTQDHALKFLILALREEDSAPVSHGHKTFRLGIQKLHNHRGRMVFVHIFDTISFLSVFIVTDRWCLLTFNRIDTQKGWNRWWLRWGVFKGGKYLNVCVN